MCLMHAQFGCLTFYGMLVKCLKTLYYNITGAQLLFLSVYAHGGKKSACDTLTNIHTHSGNVTNENKNKNNVQETKREKIG